MTDNKSNKFKDIIGEYNERIKYTKGKNDINIIGGECKEDKLTTFLDKFKEIEYRIWLYTDKIIFSGKDKPIDKERLFYLERGLIFDSGNGCLEIKRKDDGFRWNFIGDSKFETTGYSEKNFFGNNSGSRFSVYDDKMLLWGNSRDQTGGTFHDDRVACADLKYPVESCDRVYLHYKKFVRNGKTEFIWYTKPVGVKE